MSVTLTVAGPSSTQTYTTAWPGYLSAQTLLEAVYNQSHGTAQTLSFEMMFYGTAYADPNFYGYMVTALNGTADASNEYWMFSVNGTSASTGIDETYIEDGDTVEFEYTSFNADRHGITGPNAAKAQLRAANA